jgi:DNA polymerase I-like protein with 3'-5' exonuclease and polymerase domains
MQRIRSANRTAKVLEAMRLRRIQKSESRSQKLDAEYGRMAYELKYFGASTGRWSGGGGLNMQNYNRKPAEGVDLRRCIVAPPGYLLAVVDYSQIESRVLLFLAGDVETLDMFRANPMADAYEIHARATMGYVEAESLKDYCERTGSGLRQLAKARVLGLGFGCGARRFVEVAQVMAGLDIGEDESERIVKEFRESNPRIVSLWQSLNDACASCDGGNYLLPLPCTQINPDLKRFLIYRDVKVDPPSHMATEGWRGIECTVGGDRIKVYGGLLAENWTQATARDVLASAWLRCEASGFRPVLSVHDELVFEVPEGSAEEDLRRIVEIMEEPVSWAPGLPLRADGRLCSVYGK